MNPNRRVNLKRLAALAPVAALAGCAITPNAPSPAPSATPRFVTHDPFPSRQVAARKIVVWLPAGYDNGTEPHAVLYMHDGQNLFDPATSMAGQPWAVDKKLGALIAVKKVKPTIVVGIFNTPLRRFEYLPAAPVATLPADLREMISDEKGQPLSEEYLRFIVTELKPFIDKTYRTHTGRDHTTIMGSSMGGLISLYALARYPDVFGGAGCVSTHWPLATNPKLFTPGVDPRLEVIGNSFYVWLEKNLPAAGKHHLYFDHGDKNLDALYAPFQIKVDALVKSKGYRADVDWLTRVFPGADHNEPSWRERVEIPLTFLLQA
jgi:enterochelin esterase-like enzyme